MLIYSMNVSADGFIADRAGRFDWTAPTEEVFRFHLDQIRGIGGYLLGRRLFETMLVWETDPALREGELGAAFADVWQALPKVVFSGTLETTQGSARLADKSLAEEAAAVRAAEQDVFIGGAELGAAAIAGGLIDEFRIIRHPVIVGGGTPYLPAVVDAVPLELVETRSIGGQLIFERYGVADSHS